MKLFQADRVEAEHAFRNQPPPNAAALAARISHHEGQQRQALARVIQDNRASSKTIMTAETIAESSSAARLACRTTGPHLPASTRAAFASAFPVPRDILKDRADARASACEL